MSRRERTHGPRPGAVLIGQIAMDGEHADPGLSNPTIDLALELGELRINAFEHFDLLDWHSDQLKWGQANEAGVGYCRL
ncbi:MAG: hypothetical protein AAGD07_06665 [Planctomycetota bacterium]